MFFAKPLQRSNLCASHRQRRWLTHGELVTQLDDSVAFSFSSGAYPHRMPTAGTMRFRP